MKPRIHTFTLLAWLGCAVAAMAHFSAGTAVLPSRLPSAGTPPIVGSPLRAVLHDEPGDGRLWSLATAYKASFGPEGATYVPFFGSRAPRNFPVRFRLASIVAGGAPLELDPSAEPSRAGDRIVFDRGGVVEAYDLGLETVEQSFLFDTLPAGDLVIDIEVESELDRGEDAPGLVLAGEHGRVAYSRAVAIDARGARVDAPTRWRDGRIEIRVAAAELAALRPPILIDPVISTFTIAGSSPDRQKPDCAFDATTDRWAVVYERVFSASDVDVIVAVAAADGSPFYDRVVDATVALWTAPQVANNALHDQFLCVAETASSAGGTRTIRGRTIDPTVLIPELGTAFAISPAGADAHSPDVGGDPSNEAPTYYCVVWQRDTSSSDHDVFARLVAVTGTTQGSPISIATSAGTFDRAPSISPTNGPPPAALQEWTIAWQRWIASGNSDLWAARIRWDGVLTAPAFALDTSSTNTFWPDVSSPTVDAPRRTLIAYSRGPLSIASTYGILLAGSVVEDVANLTSLVGSPSGAHHLPPAADCDGHSFVVVDSETSLAPGGAQTLRLSTFVEIAGEIALAETTVLGGYAIQDQVEVACAAASGGPPARALAVHRGDATTAAFTSDVRAVLYDAGSFTTFCEPGTNGVIACPCGNPPGGAGHGCGNSAESAGARCFATLATGVVHVQAIDTVPGTLCIVSQGDAVLANGTPFGDGVRCVGGQILRLSNEIANADGACSFPGSDPTTIPARSAELGAPIAPGDVRYYYVYYRDGGAIGCAATFNTTNAVRVQW